MDFSVYIIHITLSFVVLFSLDFLLPEFKRGSVQSSILGNNKFKNTVYRNVYISGVENECFHGTFLCISRKATLAKIILYLTSHPKLKKSVTWSRSYIPHVNSIIQNHFVKSLQGQSLLLDLLNNVHPV